jgi:hypothetical protein
MTFKVLLALTVVPIAALSLCPGCGQEILKGCDGKGRVVGGLGARFDFMPKAYRPCPQFEKAGGVYQKQSKAPWESNEEIGLNTQSRERAFRFKDFTLQIEQDTAGYVASADGTGRVVWGSSYCISEILSRQPRSVLPWLDPIDAGSLPLEGARVLELGAGLGLCSIAACKLGAREVFATDGAQGVLELIERNAQANLSPVERAALSVHCLKWGTDDESCKDIVGPFDLVLLADVAYESNKAAWPALVATVERLTNVNTRRDDGNLGGGPAKSSNSKQRQQTRTPVVVWAHAARDDESRFESDRFQREILVPLRKHFVVSQVSATELHPAYAAGSNLRLFILQRRE